MPACINGCRASLWLPADGSVLQMTHRDLRLANFPQPCSPEGTVPCLAVEFRRSSIALAAAFVLSLFPRTTKFHAFVPEEMQPFWWLCIEAFIF